MQCFIGIYLYRSEFGRRKYFYRVKTGLRVSLSNKSLICIMPFNCQGVKHIESIMWCKAEMGILRVVI